MIQIYLKTQIPSRQNNCLCKNNTQLLLKPVYVPQPNKYGPNGAFQNVIVMNTEITLPVLTGHNVYDEDPQMQQIYQEKNHKKEIESVPTCVLRDLFVW